MDILPAYNVSEVNTSDSYIDQLGQFENILGEAEHKGIIHVVPSSEEETYNIENQRIRLQTVATRLFLLGYLPRRISPRRLEARIGLVKKAILKFQKDAGLVQDAWVGDKTWYALDQLVSYESNFDFDQWFLPDGAVKSEVEEALCRAAQLRLWSLGLYHRKPRRKAIHLKKVSFFKFSSILKMLQIVDDQFQADLHYDTLKLLFDQEALVQAIKRSKRPNKDSFSVKLPKTNRKTGNTLFQIFIVNIAKIELWLLGYEITIDGKPNVKYMVGGDLWNAIAHYYQNFENVSSVKAKKLASKITPKLFEGLGAAIAAVNDYDQDDASEEIARIMMPENTIKASNIFRDAWNYIKEKGVRLWDGLKRVWGWIKRIGKKVVSFIDKNIFKAFYRFVSKSFKIVKKGIAAVVKSFGVYFSGELQTDHILYKFSKDMDIKAYFDQNAKNSDLEIGIQKLQNQSKAFNLGCRMIGFLFYVFKNAVLGFFGWAKLLYALLRSYKELRLLYIDFKAVAMT